MRITISGPAVACEEDSDEIIEAVDVLRALDGARFNQDSIGKYLDPPLPKLGIIGGEVRFEYSYEQDLVVHTDYWAPRELTEDELKALIDETLGQMSDGLGENGFDIEIGDRRVYVFSQWQQREVDVEQLDDGKSVPPPPIVAIYAGDGELERMNQALDEGGDVDSRLQEETALCCAIYGGHVEAAITLLERGADPHGLVRGQSPLFACAFAMKLSDEDSAHVATELLQRGTDRNQRDSHDNTATYFAEIRGKTALVKVLSEEN